MTLTEKVGQLMLRAGCKLDEQGVPDSVDLMKQIEEGKVGTIIQLPKDMTETADYMQHYIGLLNVHLLDDAKRIKNKFMATVEHVFEKEYKLFEKYDGNTGEISNCEYDAPEMLGWTAAAYLYFNNIKD